MKKSNLKWTGNKLSKKVTLDIRNTNGIDCIIKSMRGEEFFSNVRQSIAFENINIWTT